MILANRYTYPALDRHTREDGVRHYVCPETGLHVPSVTTIIDSGANKDFLVEWRKRIGDKEADRQSNYGKGLGSLVHENIENHILGIPRPIGNAPMRVLSRKMADRIIDTCLPRVSEIWGIETPLYVKGIYAGTSDLIGVHDNQPAIMDHKNAKKMRKREDIGDYFLQLAAYAEAHDEKYGTSINKGVIFMVDRSLVCKSYTIDGLEFKNAKAAWWKRVTEYYEMLTRVPLINE